MKFLGRPIADYIRVAKSVIYTAIHHFSFGFIGRGVFIFSPLQVNGAKNIYIRKGVHIGYKTWIAAVPQTGKDNVRLEIGEGCSIGNFNHIYATQSIIIGNHVLTADKVYLSDNCHGYKDINTPIKYQQIVQKNPVIIGEGSWIGENVCVIGASIGKHCIIGANSVVTKDIPDYSVAVGSPAKIIKKYDFKNNTWIKCNVP